MMEGHSWREGGDEIRDTSEEINFVFRAGKIFQCVCQELKEFGFISLYFSL